MSSNTKFFVAAAAAALASTATAQETCGTATPIVDGTVMFDTTAAVDEMTIVPTCGGTGPANDIWYAYTAAADGMGQFSLCGSGFDTRLEIFDDCAGAALACNDDFCTLQSELILPLTTGTTYYIRVFGWNGATGMGQLTVDGSFVPGDECATALPIDVDTPTAFDTTPATESDLDFSCIVGTGDPRSPDLWYTFTASATYMATATTCGTAAYDTKIEVYDGDCGMLNSIACDDDTTGCAGFTSEAMFPVTAGTQYWVRVGGWRTTSFGTGDLLVTGPPPPPAGCATTLFASNNGGAVGGAVFFDLTLANATTLTGISTNYGNAAGESVGVEMYTVPGTHVGNEMDMSLWTLAAVDNGQATAAGDDNPTAISFSDPAHLAAGTWGVALVAVNADHEYTNGTGMNETATSGDGNITITAGAGQNTPFSSGLFMPRVWNGQMCAADNSIGSNYCGIAVPNSTGGSGQIGAYGSTSVADNNLLVVAQGLPAGNFGLFLNSATQDFVPVPVPGETVGNLCLGGEIGRGAVVLSSALGSASTQYDLSALPQPMGPVSVMAGEAWYFQLWYRDSGSDSNYTDAICITFD